ncbi:recombinase RecT [Hydrogenophaga sp.]|uniref:recombinase RecT n=1 Tax=Hydrogenophaga sp. TaxID=1904254 RepID=UPI003D121BC8
MSNSNAVALIREDIYSVQERFDKMAGGALNFEREAGFAVQVITGNEYAMKIAMANRQSVIHAVTNVGAIGISLNPAKRQAYLVPRDGKICLDISYMGLLDLAIQSGSIMWGQAELVYAADRFELRGFDNPPLHNRDPFAPDRGAIVGVYVVVKTRDGDYLTTTMSISDVFDIRDRSQSWKSGQKGPWKTDEGEMIKKTVIKRAYKLWPKTDRLDQAVEHLNRENGEGLDPIDNRPAATVITARDALAEAMASLPIEEQNILRELGQEVTDLFNSEEFGASFAFDRIERENLDGDQKSALWYVLPSGVRSGLKAEGDARKKRKPAAAEAA